jgi:hypothetical protein
MPVIFCSLSALLVASIFYGWRGYAATLRQRQLRERVAYLLWVVANHAA